MSDAVMNTSDFSSFSEAEARGVERLLIERADDGGVIVADPTGAAYGVGSSLGEAVQQWEEIARQHYEDLREQAGPLHPRIRRQLNYLTRLFGAV